MRAPYFQFSEARTGGPFTFNTGAGGFVQEFLYGYTGFRWRAAEVRLDPSLPPQLDGVTVSALHWRGRGLRIAVGQRRTTVTPLSGAPAPVRWSRGSGVVAQGDPLVLPTRRPDLTTTDDAARCRPVSERSATLEPAEAAVDGLLASHWVAAEPHASPRVDLGSATALGSIGVLRAPVTTFAATEPGGKGVTKPTRSAGERIEVSLDGSTWQVVATVRHAHLRDLVDAGGRQARYVRLVAFGATAAKPLIIGELTVKAAG
jgi:hypothetical protein